MQTDSSPPVQVGRPSMERELVEKYGLEMPVLLWRWRWKERLTQAQVADRLGVAVSTVSTWYVKHKVQRWMPPPPGAEDPEPEPAGNGGARGGTTRPAGASPLPSANKRLST